MKPKVSIILPNYNHAPFLQERIDSILNQSYQDFELIILDDSSTDNSLEILNQYKNHSKVSHFIVNMKNSGSPFKQWKKGIELAKGDWIWIAESDDVADVGFLEHLLNKEEADFFFIKTVDFSTTIKEYQERNNYYNNALFESNFKMNAKDFCDEHLLVFNSIPNVSACLIKKRLFNHICWPTDFRKAGDVFIYAQLLNKANYVMYSTHLKNYFRNSPSNTRKHIGSNERIIRWLEYHIVRDKFFSHCNNFKQVQKSECSKWLNGISIIEIFKFLFKKRYYRFIFFVFKLRFF